MLPFTEAGTAAAPSIVLLHGGGLRARQWQPQFDQLAEFHLLAPDLPGQGRSVGRGPFTLEGAADGVEALIAERATQGRAHIVGLSLGGAVALTLLQRRVRGLESVFVTGTAAGLGRALAAISSWSAGLYDVLPSHWLSSLAIRQFGIPPEFAPTFREDLKIGTTATFTREFTQALAAMTLPTEASVRTLVAVGERETIAARNAAKTLLKTIRGAHGIHIPAVGHVWNLEAPALFSETVRAWVTGAPLPATIQRLPAPN